LQRYAQLQDVSGTQSLSAEDSQVVKRAQRIQQFLTQPFFVAEAYTDIPGEYVKVEDTIQGFKELLEGHYDDVPVEAFWFVGTIDHALAKAQKNV
jgi:F-type H+/Na+-transporting ATPase subunit beta